MKKWNKKSLAELALMGLMAGGLSLTACDKKESENKAAEKTPLEKFKEECEAAGKQYEDIASCSGNSTCAGEFMNSSTNEKTVHDCAGKNSCMGGNCKG